MNCECNSDHEIAMRLHDLPIGAETQDSELTNTISVRDALREPIGISGPSAPGTPFRGEARQESDGQEGRSDSEPGSVELDGPVRIAQPVTAGGLWDFPTRNDPECTATDVSWSTRYLRRQTPPRS